MNCIGCGAPIKSCSIECPYCGCSIESGPKALEAECLLCHNVIDFKVPDGISQALGKGILYVCIMCAHQARQKIESSYEGRIA